MSDLEDLEDGPAIAETVSPEHAAEEAEAVAEALRIAEVHKRAGRLKQAAAVFAKVLELDPNRREAIMGLADLAVLGGNPMAAVPLYNKVLADHPNSVDAFNNRGIVYLQLQDPEAAELSFRRALKIDPDDPDATLNLGSALMAQKQAEEAVAQFRKAVALQPDRPRPLYNLAVGLTALDQDGHGQDVIGLLRRVLDLQPDFAEARVNLGNMLLRQGQSKEALAAYDHAILERPDDGIIFFNKAQAQVQLDDIAGAVKSLEAAKELMPDPSVADRELARLSHARGWLKRAVTHYVNVLAKHADDKAAYAGMGHALFDEGHLAKARQAFQRAGNHPVARRGLRHIRLLEREADPWEIYGEQALRRKPKDRTLPLWDGATAPGGPLLLETAALSPDDTLLLIRLAEDLAGRVPAVWVEASPRLAPVLARAKGVARVVGDSAEAAEAAAVLPLDALPRLLGHRNGTLPFAGPYLVPEAERERPWADPLFESNFLRVGIFWQRQGQISGVDQDLPLEAFETLIGLDGIKPYSLADRAGTLEQAHLADLGIENLAAQCRDGEDMLAALDRLDLVIGCDSPILHMAAALDRPTWLLLPVTPGWRWGRSGGRTDYYPAMSLFRQQAPNDWAAPLAAAEAALRDRLGRA